MARGEPAEPRSHLPAPYRSPWRWLAEALQAVLATLALKLRELWRRNRQGSLPLPRFWPRSLAALFWPLLLALGLCALALPFGLARISFRSAGAGGGSGAPPGAPAAQQPLVPGSTTASRAADGSRLPLSPAQQRAAEASSEAPLAAAVAPAAADREPAARTAAVNLAERLDATAEPIAAARAPVEPALQLDPLLALLSDPQDRDLLQSAQPDPAAASLRLRLSERAASLSDRSLLQRAERWQQRALEAGYDRIELLAADGSLLARQALVGSGMILLASSPSPP